jgi:hypothetical protein
VDGVTVAFGRARPTPDGMGQALMAGLAEVGGASGDECKGGDESRGFD